MITCIDMFTDVHEHMSCIDICTDTCIEMCIDMCIDMCLFITITLDDKSNGMLDDISDRIFDGMFYVCV